MSREIKFRTFIDGEMIFLPLAALQYFDFEGSYALSFVVDGYEGFFAHENYDSKEIIKRCAEAPIMQFTGLKDKSGVDIYEGDIISLGKDFPYKYIVEFIEGSFKLVHSELKNEVDKIPLVWGDLIKCIDDVIFKPKVIGNIYQNPDVLK